jgi:hypothetical protein
MLGAALVLVLAGLVFPITMLLAAVVFDVLVLAWFLFYKWRHDVWPRLAGPMAGHGHWLPGSYNSHPGR